MDPVSISSSIIGFISFIHGIGGFIGRVVTAETGQKEVIKQYQDHIGQLKRILFEVEAYREELQAASPKNQSVDFSQLEACLNECRVKLEKFVNKLKNPGLLDRVKWPLRQEKSKKIFDLVNQYKTSLQQELAFKQGLVVHATARDIYATALDINTKSAVTQERTLMMQRAEIVKRLDIVDVNAPLDKAREKCHPGTGEWFLTSRAFMEFKNESGEHLWLHAMPGAGKTVLCGSIIAALMDYIEDQPLYALAYFFFSFRAYDKQNVYNMLSSIAGQLCRQAKIIPEKVIMELDRNMSRLPTPVLLELISCLCRCFYRVYIVLDALDEIKLEERKSLVDMLQRFIGSGPSNTNVLLTSRYENYLLNGFKKLPIQELPLHTTDVDDDIRLYVSETLSKAETSWGWSLELCETKENILKTLTKGTKGMFHWVDCQMDNLKNCQRPWDVEETLCSLPEDLDETYKQVLLSVDKRYKVYVARLLAWITFTPEDLCVHLLAEAIVFEPDTSKVDPRQRFSPPETIIGLCRHLISAYPSPLLNHCPDSTDYTDIHIHLTLSHYSVKEYLLSERFNQDEELTVYSSLLKKGHSYVMDVWIKYWQMVAFQYHPNLGRDKISLGLLKHCLFYSIKHGGNLENDLAQQQWIQQIACLVHMNFDLTRLVLETDIPFQKLIYSLVIPETYDHFSDHVQPMGPLSLPVVPTLPFAQNGTTTHDIVNGCFGEYSPALAGVLGRFTHIPERWILSLFVSLLLQGGSLVYSPHYPCGSFIPDIARFIHKKGYGPAKLLFEFLTTAPECHQSHFDPILEAYDGLVHSFVGETTEYYAAIGDLHSLTHALIQGANIKKPVRQPGVITTLFKLDLSAQSTLYYSFNIFCALDTFCLDTYAADNWLSRNQWIDRLALLLKHSGDINTIDCIIGSGTNHEIIDLEYCTALDLLQSLQKTVEGLHLKNQLNMPKRLLDTLYVRPIKVLLLGASILKEHGAKVLPREPVTKGSWRISDESYYGHVTIVNSIMHYERHL